MKKLLLSFGISTLMLSTNIVPILPISSVQAQDNTISNLPDGNYVYSGDYWYNTSTGSPSLLQNQKIMFRKHNNIISGYWYMQDFPICFQGILNEYNSIENIVNAATNWNNLGGRFSLSTQLNWQTEARNVGQDFNDCLNLIGNGYYIESLN